MRDYDSIFCEFWLDAGGQERRTPTSRKLHFPRMPLHAALRAFVYKRDNFTCCQCGTQSIEDVSNFDGRTTLLVERRTRDGEHTFLVIDHILSRRNGGTNHPKNLQTLCYVCNAIKASTVDAKGFQHGSH